MFYLYASDVQVYKAKLFLGSGISDEAISTFYGKCRKIISPIGANLVLGNNSVCDIIQIDESKFGKKQKGNVGKAFRRYWVFGMVEKGTRKTHFRYVKKRNADTLLPIIESHVTQGSSIWSDDWKAYKKLDERGFEHSVVVHKYEFVSEQGICTNHIEGLYKEYVNQTSYLYCISDTQ